MHVKTRRKSAGNYRPAERESERCCEKMHSRRTWMVALRAQDVARGVIEIITDLILPGKVSILIILTWWNKSLMLSRSNKEIARNVKPIDFLLIAEIKSDSPRLR